ncbi:amidohydrolase family protein [Actinomadura opuntiae]|uniref:amidohydrolase family protein n=1 Tax=Actinomadura sp. OS1-43 TaxID=604315 RepID=UPI00255B2C50|nr:amidohydrolase family protein [Actinomadura sp. OS1-43]MDL4818511.1 amidohydrolase family protein [Actinomadura sp. OS1-43]
MTAALLLKSATVVDTRDGTLTPGTDVLMHDGRILQVRPGIAVPDGLRSVTVDVDGTYVVPGYNDMHAHPLGNGDHSGALRLMLAHGITGFRQMSGTRGLLRARSAGTLAFPTASPALLATPGPLLTPANAATPAMAAATVREQHRAGADFIKVGMVSPEVFFAAQAEALRLGLPIAGHLPPGIDVRRASRIGVKSVEHLGPGVALFACCSKEHTHIEDVIAEQRRPKLPPFKIPFLEPILGKALRKMIVNPANRSRPADVRLLDHTVRSFDDDLARSLARRLAADGTWQVPTLIRLKTSQLCDDPAFAADPDLRYMGPATLKEWTAAAEKYSRFPGPARATFQAAYRRQLELTELFDEAGVPMLAGSDSSGAVWEVPGAALHHEFDELGHAGLTPLRVLQMTTLRAAQFLDATDTMGTVAPGKNADLVLLAGNPVESVANLHRITAVVRAGRHYSAADLDAIKEGLAAAPAVN